MKNTCIKCGFSGNRAEWEYCQQCGTELATAPAGKIQVATSRAKLVTCVDEQSATEFEISKEFTTIGRSDHARNIMADIDLTPYDLDFSVSRPHARIISRNNKYYIEDIKSTNGTTVNGGPPLPPATPHELNNNDIICISKVKLKLVVW